MKKGALRDFAKFTRKHLLIKLQVLSFIKKETLAQVFPVNFAKFLRTPFLQNTSGRLLLKITDFKCSLCLLSIATFNGIVQYKLKWFGVFIVSSRSSLIWFYFQDVAKRKLKRILRIIVTHIIGSLI